MPFPGQSSAHRVPVTTSLKAALGTDSRKRPSNVARRVRERAERGPFLRFPTKKGFYETHYTCSPVTHHTACHSQSAFTTTTTTALPIIPRDPPEVSPILLPYRPLLSTSLPHTPVLILTVHQGPDPGSLFQEGSQGNYVSCLT